MCGILLGIPKNYICEDRSEKKVFQKYCEFAEVRNGCEGIRCELRMASYFEYDAIFLVTLDPIWVK